MASHTPMPPSNPRAWADFEGMIPEGVCSGGEVLPRGGIHLGGLSGVY